MIERYVQHIKDSENKSVLARIYGLYRVKKEKQVPVDLIVLSNLIKDVDTEKIKYQYLLTGESGKTAPRNLGFDIKEAILQYEKKEVSAKTEAEGDD